MIALPTTVDALLGGRVSLEQPSEGFRASIDAVLLGAALDAAEGASVLDAGCSTGAAALCLAWRRPDLALTGLEVDQATAALARANVARNGVGDRIEVVAGDLLRPPPSIKERSFDAVMSNPPFNDPAGRAAASAHRALAMADVAGPEAWLAACLRRLAPRGQLALIHRADRLPAVLAALATSMGEIEIIPLWPACDGRPARRVVVRGRKGVKGPASLTPGLVLHGPAGNFTEAAQAILRDGAALDDVLARRRDRDRG